MKRIVYVLIMVMVTGAVGAAGPKIYINPGHGGYNSNDRNIVTINHASGDHDGFWESQANLTKGLYLRDMLQTAGATVYMSRTDNRSGYRDDKSISNTIGDRPLSTIAREGSQKGDFFLSIHSNASGNSTTSATNYLLLMLTGTSGSGDWASSYKYPEAVTAANLAKNRLGDHPMTWWSSNSKRMYSYETYTVISPSYLTKPGYLSEGEFHDYKPETHRLLNDDYCKLEAYRFLQAFCDYYPSLTRPTTGVICGDVRDNTATMDSYTLYQKAKDDDNYKPLNGAKVKLKDGSGNVIATYICDDEWNGFYAFWDVAPGTYTVVCAAADHASNSRSVTVTANEITYNHVKLGPGSGDEMSDVTVNPLSVLYDTLISQSDALSMEDKSIRRAVVKDDSLYVLTNDCHIYILNANTGVQIGELSTSGISVSSDNDYTKLINDIALTEDKVLLGCQLEQTKASPVNYWQVYSWANNASNPAVFRQSRNANTAANLSTANTGYTFCIKGTSSSYHIYTIARNPGLGTFSYRAVTCDASTTYYSKNDNTYTTATLSDDTRMVASPFSTGDFVMESTTMHPTLYKGKWDGSNASWTTVATLTLPDAALSGGTFVTYDSHILYITPYGTDNVGVGIYDATSGLGSASLIKTLYPETELALASAGYMTASAQVDGDEMVVTLYVQNRGINRWRLSQSELEQTVPVVPVVPVSGASIFASELTMSESGETYTFNYRLNTDATDVTLQLIYEGNVVQTKSFGAQAKGTRSGSISRSEITFPAYNSDDHLTWAIKATAAGTNVISKLSNDDTKYKFFRPFGVAVDNNSESEYFGRVYVTNVKNGTAGGRTTANGLYAFDAELTALNNEAYTGGVTWNNSTENGNSPFRLAVAEDGRVFLCDWSDQHSGIWITPSGGITGNFIELFSGTRLSSGIRKNGSDSIHGSISGCWVEGSGSNTKLYTMDEDLRRGDTTYCMWRYDIGTATSWNTKPSAIEFDNKANGIPLVNGTLKMVADKQGGWWIIQYRYAETSKQPSMIHVRNGAIDYNTGGEQLLENSCRGGLAVNYDGTRIATTSEKQINVWDVTYKADGSFESISPVAEITNKDISSGLGTYSNDVAFDPAGNLYYVSNSTERLVVIGLPKADNSFVTPARSIYTIPMPDPTPILNVVIAEWQQNGLTVDFKAAPTATAVTVEIGNSVSETVNLQALNATISTGTTAQTNYKQINLPTVDLTTYRNQTMTLKWLNNSAVIAQTIVTIPTLVAGNVVISTLSSNAGDWTDAACVVLPNGTLQYDLSSFSGALTIGSLEIYPGGTAKVTDGVLTMTNLILRGGWTTARTAFRVPHLSIADNASVVKTNAYLDWVIDYAQFYPVAVPFPVTVSSISYRDYPSANASQGVLFREYDGAKRATGTTGDNWTSITPTTLLPSHGYAMTAKRPASIMFCVIRMPLTCENTWLANGEQATVSATSKNTIDITAYGVGGSGKWNDLGWNFVANPYLVPFNSTSDEPSFSGLMQLQESAVRYATIPRADFQDYTQKPVSEAALEPMSAFFIQAQSSGSLVFATTNKILKPSSGTKHSPASQINVDARIRLTGNNRSDQTYLLIGEDFTDEPDFNADLPKMFGIAPKIYSIYGGDSLASLALPTELAGEVIPLGMQIGEAGQYTFSLTENSTIQGIERLDLIDGQTVVADLLQDDYTVQLSAGEIERFRLRAVLPNTNPSELEHDASNDLDDVRKYIVNQHVVIERNGDKYDVLGRSIKQ